MILDGLQLTPAELEAATGWQLKPEGLCRDERCVPFSSPLDGAGTIDVASVADRLHMPLVHDERHGVWALGPEAGGRVLASARLPPITLPDVDGTPFDFESLRGRKVVISAWASW